MLRTINRFLKDSTGGMASFWVFAMVPVLASVGMAVDYSNMSRLRHDLGNAADSTCTVVGRGFMAGKSRADIVVEAQKYFDTNFDAQYLEYSELQLTLPDDAGNETKQLVCKGLVEYHPFFGPMFAGLFGGDANDYVTIIKESKMKMKNVAEIALVLDNSGSMAWDKYGNSASVANQRMTLLKTAAKKLVTDMVTLGEKIHETADPVKFSLVPFAASVNVGPQNRTKSWMDTRGISPIHHEHLDWGLPSPTNPTGFRTVAADGAKLDASGNPLSRFSILDALSFQTGGTSSTTQCEVWKPGSTANGTNYANCMVFRRTGTTSVKANSAAAATAINNASYNLAWLKDRFEWKGCVEARPNGLDVTDTPATLGNPASLIVPMFANDELNVSQYGTSVPVSGDNDWWPDYETDANLRGSGFWTFNDTGQLTSTNPTNSTWISGTSRPRTIDVAKYIVNKPYISGTGTTSTYNRTAQWTYFRSDTGPNMSCTINPITPLTGNKTTLNAAIDAMAPNGNTNVPEGLAWGWRTISSAEPFSEGVPESRKDIDKVVIVLTDGANTYTALGTGDNNDMQAQKTTYAAYGYTGYAGNAGTNGTASPSTNSNVARMYKDTSASKTTHNSDNFQKAMDERMLATCTNIKGEDILLMTVALDLDPANYDTAAEKAAVNKALATLSNCAGNSRTRKNGDGTPSKLFWNAKSDNLDQTFKEIADELSNLRFTN